MKWGFFSFKFWRERERERGGGYEELGISWMISLLGVFFWFRLINEVMNLFWRFFFLKMQKNGNLVFFLASLKPS